MTKPAKSNPNTEPYPKDKAETKPEQMDFSQTKPYATLGNGRTSSVELVFRVSDAVKPKLR